MTAADLTQIEALSAQQRLELVRVNHDVLLACLANRSTALLQLEYFFCLYEEGIYQR